MDISKNDLAHLAYDAQQAALVQLGGSAGSTWETLSLANRQTAHNRVSFFQSGGIQASAFNTALPGAGLTVGSTPVVTNAVATMAKTMVLSAATLTGTTNIGDTFVVAGVTYTIQNVAAAASNSVTVQVEPKVPVAIAASTAFSSYTAVAATAGKAQLVFDAVCIAAAPCRGV